MAIVRWTPPREVSSDQERASKLFEEGLGVPAWPPAVGITCAVC